MDLIGVNDLPQWWGVLRIVAPNDAAVGRRLGRCGEVMFAHARHCCVRSILLINQCGSVRRNVKKSLVVGR